MFGGRWAASVGRLWLMRKLVGPIPARRNVVAAGLSRFTEGELKPQPDWEQLTERVVCVLAQSPSRANLPYHALFLFCFGEREGGWTKVNIV